MIENLLSNQHKRNIQWFTFHFIVEHTTVIVETDISIILLILKVFANVLDTFILI